MEILVFGSNLAGIHGAGSAKLACEQYGAEWGIGEGRTGNAYAIPTKGTSLHRSRELNAIKESAQEFIRYAESNPDCTFKVVKVGCGLAGYTEAQIAPMFKDAPANCNLPDGWRVPPAESGEQ